MNMFLKASAAIAMIAGLGAPALAQTTPATATGNASVNIIAPIAITAGTTALNFGTVAKAAGNVVVSATDGSRSTDSTLKNVANSTTARQTFSITGDGGRFFTPTITDVTFTSSNPPVVTLSDNGVRQIPAGGTASLGIGGELTIDANTGLGIHNGTFSVSVAYN